MVGVMGTRRSQSLFSSRRTPMHGGMGWLLANDMAAVVYTRIEGGNKQGCDRADRNTDEHGRWTGTRTDLEA
jgi:hypothetical protein